jgi:trimeric autotransporter adhesin
MKTKQVRVIGYCLIVGLVATLTIGCSKKTTTRTLSSIAVTPNPAPVLTVSYSQSFNATATYSNGSTTDISAQAVWKSSEINVATIDSSGSANGLAVGTTNITATLDGITSPSVTLFVITLSSIIVTPNPPNNLAVGSPEQFTAIGYNWDGSNANITSQVTWSSDNTGTATITSTGLATGVAAGTANITAALSGITSSPLSLTVGAAASNTSTPTTTPSATLTTSR